MIRMTFPPITTRQSFTDVLELFSDVDGAPFNMTGASVQVSIASEWPCWWRWISTNNRIPYYDGSIAPSPILTLKTSDGTIPTAFAAIGKYPYVFTPAQIATLCPGQYMVGANISRNGFTAFLLLGGLSVLDGVVPQ